MGYGARARLHPSYAPQSGRVSLLKNVPNQKETCDDSRSFWLHHAGKRNRPGAPKPGGKHDIQIDDDGTLETPFGEIKKQGN